MAKAISPTLANHSEAMSLSTLSWPTSIRMVISTPLKPTAPAQIVSGSTTEGADSRTAARTWAIGRAERSLWLAPLRSTRNYDISALLWERCTPESPDVAPHVFQGWKGGAPCNESFQIRLSANDTFCLCGIAQDVSVRIDNQAAAIVSEFGIGAASVRSRHVGLVLNRPRLQQSHPMLNARNGPIGNDRKELRPLTNSRAKQFGETQVVANEWRHQAILPVESDDLFACDVILRFTSQSKWLHLAVTAKFLALR